MRKIDEDKLVELSTTNKLLDDKYGTHGTETPMNLTSSLWHGFMAICSKSVARS